jgi:hypothetical protein
MHQARKSAIMEDMERTHGARVLRVPRSRRSAVLEHTSQSIIETAPKFPRAPESSTACLHEQGNTERYQHAYPRVTAIQLYERYGMHQEKAFVWQEAGWLHESR